MHVVFMGMFVMMIVLRVFVLMFMMVLTMLMHVFIFFHTVNNNMRVRAFDSAFDALFEFICNVRNTKRIKLILTGFNVARELGKRCKEHVSCSAHIAFDIKSLHV